MVVSLQTFMELKLKSKDLLNHLQLSWSLRSPLGQLSVKRGQYQPHSNLQSPATRREV